MCVCVYWISQMSLVALCRPLRVWFTNHLQCCHGDDAVYSLQLCSKRYLRNRAYELPLCDNNAVNSAVSWINKLTILSLSLFCLHSEPEVLPSSASVLAVLYSHLSIFFSVSNVLGSMCGPLGWISKGGSAAATWQITGNVPDLLSNFVTLSFLMKFCSQLSNL